MRIKIVRMYAPYDKTFSGDAYRKILYVDNKEVMSGDDYHENIEDRFMGFLNALKYMEISYSVTNKNINSDNEW